VLLMCSIICGNWSTFHSMYQENTAPGLVAKGGSADRYSMTKATGHGLKRRMEQGDGENSGAFS
jgi:hypothetical protein